MGFSIKLAPGVRIRASSRGLRTSIGPRAARVHVGGGRTGFSTGVGPASFYTSAEPTAKLAGPSKELTALDLHAGPELAALVAAVDIADLTSEGPESN